jgi:hypothetical protein
MTLIQPPALLALAEMCRAHIPPRSRGFRGITSKTAPTGRNRSTRLRYGHRLHVMKTQHKFRLTPHHLA